MANRIKRVLFVGTRNTGGNDVSLRKGFEKLLGMENVDLLDQAECLKLGSLETRIWQRLLKRAPPWNQHRFEARFLDRVRDFQPDLIFCFKSLRLRGETLKRAKDLAGNAVFAHFHPDNLLNPRTSSADFDQAFSQYDIHFVPKRNSLKYYQGRGARAHYLPYAADPDWHRPVHGSSPSKLAADVTFIGHYEAERGESIRSLAMSGVSGIRVWGPSWMEWGKKNPRVQVESRGLYLGEMSEAFTNSTVNLGFLRHANLDHITARTFEIPAAEGCMVHERTSEAMEFYEDGKDALFFGDDTELLEIVRRLVTNKELAREIARNGRERTERDGYSYENRAAEVLEVCSSMNN